MYQKFNIATTLIIFYCILTPFIMVGSLANLVDIINGTGNVIHLGAFSILGFIILPVLLYVTYIKNTLYFKSDHLTINKYNYPYASYSIKLETYTLKLVDRPLVSLWKKTYFRLVIRKRNSSQVVYEGDISMFPSSFKKLQKIFQQVNALYSK